MFPLKVTPVYEFHISRRARERYQFDESLFALNGNVILVDFAAARQFADRLSAGRGAPVPASDINAMGLIDEVLHVLVRQYDLQHPGVIARALTHLEDSLGPIGVGRTLLRFTEEFPPLAVYRGEMSAQDYLNRATNNLSHREIALEELIVLHVSTLNPALDPYRELFDIESLRQSVPYDAVIQNLETFFAGEKEFGESGETLLRILLAPALASPDSLQGQLEYILKRWGAVIGERYVLRILRGVDYIVEEIIRQTGPGDAGGAAQVLDYHAAEYSEYERFSADRDWMPRCVLIAKNSYVWLDQLSKKYQRAIARLDQIPDEELETLARRGFTGLWLIGLWERSRASQKIKQMMGGADAVASAYSLMDYAIASDFGGEEAYRNLRERAWRYGIRLAADMVPNHFGIDARWVIEHPDWFLSLDQPPYPSYTFNSENLSDDPRVAIVLEDHYYDHSDASVVFKLHNHATNETKYIYHGNDGTSFPWNDTAQLDYLNPEAREAVIQTILHVARNFPIIRFDAAMTLAKKHIQRLWFPEPGQGGAIPSRSEHGLTRAEFDQRIPNEFWREVVDRVAAEVPDTLLLAEAFWLMEGYFVRTLGMHRVYNSAFMHMLREEDNAKYRQVIKNTLEFDPQVLKRFVNFMNNPDEKSASEQFGTTDKYFGVATLLATLPGLPMFGHGQVEGFREKYGHEFRRAQLDESIDEGLVRGHEFRIFPILHRRSLFADVDLFLLYDFFTTDGNVNEDVFAFSNGHHGERALVVYHNKHARTRGWIKTSAAYMDKASGSLVQRTLGEGLGLIGHADDYILFRDAVSGMEYIRSCRELIEQGLYVELGSYQCQVFLVWRFVDGSEWGMVNSALNGAGVESVQGKWEELFGIKDESGKKKDEEESAALRLSKGGKRKEGKKNVKRKTKESAVKKKPAAKKAVVKKKEEKKKAANTKIKKSVKKPAVKKPAGKVVALKKTGRKKTVKRNRKK
jgi:glycosidase